ncbi:ATP-binding protein [Halorubrum kocurii]|uniref:Uncharacterized protein n=1 Tax=Halorubrum kocurii JCM 14978 TaxID=1230456 RepID=M0NHH6_9EURY|nr:ATP-binding protein [Halorubrum kocurii]EMA57013.1 hypothetical protein C468_16909 [Halorubrum kocurii JCM 14978]
MIVWPEIFDDETPPPNLRHREQRIQQLIQLLHQARTDSSQGALTTGSSGVGQTVLEELAHEYGAM